MKATETYTKGGCGPVKDLVDEGENRNVVVKRPQDKSGVSPPVRRGGCLPASMISRGIKGYKEASEVAVGEGRM